MVIGTYVYHPYHGNIGPHEHNAPKSYPVKMDTRDMILSLSDYPDNRLYVPMEKLIDENFERLVDITGIEPLKVFNDEDADARLTFKIIQQILLLTQDRYVRYATNGRFWQMFSTVWDMNAELTRQNLVEIYKGIYRTGENTNDSVGNTNGNTSSVNESHNHNEGSNDSKGTSESTTDARNKSVTANLPSDQVNISIDPDTQEYPYASSVSGGGNKSDADSKSHNWGWNASDAQAKSQSKSSNVSNNTSSSHGVSQGPMFETYLKWVQADLDMTGGMYTKMQKAGLWSVFI